MIRTHNFSFAAPERVAFHRFIVLVPGDVRENFLVCPVGSTETYPDTKMVRTLTTMFTFKINDNV